MTLFKLKISGDNRKRKEKAVSLANRLFCSGGQGEEEPGVIFCVPLSVSRNMSVTGKCLLLPFTPTSMSGSFSSVDRKAR